MLLRKLWFGDAEVLCKAMSEFRFSVFGGRRSYSRQACAACASQPRGQRLNSFLPHAGQSTILDGVVPEGRVFGIAGVRIALGDRRTVKIFGTQIASLGGLP